MDLVVLPTDSGVTDSGLDRAQQPGLEVANEVASTELDVLIGDGCAVPRSSEGVEKATAPRRSSEVTARVVLKRIALVGFFGFAAFAVAVEMYLENEMQRIESL